MKIQRDRFFETKSGTAHHLELTIVLSTQKQTTMQVLQSLDERTIGDALITALNAAERVVKHHAQADGGRPNESVRSIRRVDAGGIKSIRKPKRATKRGLKHVLKRSR